MRDWVFLPSCHLCFHPGKEMFSVCCTLPGKVHEVDQYVIPDTDRKKSSGAVCSYISDNSSDFIS